MSESKVENSVLSKEADADITTPSPQNATSGAQLTINIYAQLTKSPERIAPPKIKSVDPTVDDNVIRAVDTYYDTLESARQALLEMLYQKGFEVFFNGMWEKKAIGRITRKMTVLRLKREQWFHQWIPEQVMEYAPYWKELITKQELAVFCEADDINKIKDFFTVRYTIDVKKESERVYGIIRLRNSDVNSPHDDDLEACIESVVNAYVDNFAIKKLTMFLNNIYHEMLGKTPTNAPVDINVGVDVDADIDYVIQTVRHIMQKRVNDKRKRLERQEQKREEEERKRREEEEQKREEAARARALQELKDIQRKERQRKMQGTRRRPTEYGQPSGTVAPAEAEPQEARNSTSKKSKKDNKQKGGINGN